MSYWKYKSLLSINHLLLTFPSFGAGHFGQEYVTNKSPFQKSLMWVEWVEWVTDSCRHSTPHHSGAEERRRLSVIPLLLKHIEAKQHAGSWHEEDKISMTAVSSLPLHYLEACSAKLPRLFHFFSPQCISSFFFSLFFCTFSHISFPVLSWVVQTAAQPTLISQLLRLYWSTHSLAPTSARLCMFRATCIFQSGKPWQPSPIMFLQLLGNGCVPGWVPACTMLISPK